MLYQGYQALNDFTDPFRSAAKTLLRWRDLIGPDLSGFPQNHIFAWLDVSAHARVTHKRPPFNIPEVMSEGRAQTVVEEVALACRSAICCISKSPMSPRRSRRCWWSHPCPGTSQRC
jgi:poly-beta-hydroxyalkanoate depolymerase